MTRPVRVSLGRLADVPVPNPDRTTLRDCTLGTFSDVEVREWPSRGAMLTAYRMARAGTNPYNLRPYRREDR
jgi:hypothetical protein